MLGLPYITQGLNYRSVFDFRRRFTFSLIFRSATHQVWVRNLERPPHIHDFRPVLKLRRSLDREHRFADWVAPRIIPAFGLTKVLVSATVALVGIMASPV